MIFCDTSTVAKLYVPELESVAVRERLEAEDEVCVSELMRPELMAVFHRRLREGKWTRSDFSTVVRQFSTDDIGGFWAWLPLDSVIAEAAARSYVTLPEDVFLRSADCIHLVTALHHNFAEIYTHDKHQTTAAPTLGLKPTAIQP
ncbi:MAG: type II toxin-antitoxin system VapC family toxin [Deltaproteobacteria bacterium]|nr:type II toxin-antitoxin system VapC family toxin [Deltaproteobacteria bacterium]